MVQALGVRVTGTVASCNPCPRWSGWFDVKYTFSAGGRVRFDTAEMDRPFPAGGPLEVRHLPGIPGWSVPATEPVSVAGLVLSAFGILCGVGLVIYVKSEVPRARRALRAVAEGRLVRARIVESKDKGKYLRVTYEVDGPAGPVRGEATIPRRKDEAGLPDAIGVWIHESVPGESFYTGDRAPPPTDRS